MKVVLRGAISSFAGLLLLAFGVGAHAEPSTRNSALIEGRVTRAGKGERVRVEIRRLFDLDAHLQGPAGLAILQRLMAGLEAWAPVATVETNSDGHYVVENLQPGVYDATAIAADDASDWTGITLPVPGARVEAPLLLPPVLRVVRGLAAYRNGRPFQGQVLTSPAWTRQEYENCALRVRSAQLGSDGAFTTRKIGTDEYDVIASIPGELRVRASLPPSAPEGWRFTVDDGFVDLRFRVVEDSDGKPIEGAELFAGGDTPSGGAALVRGVTDGEGRCVMRAIGGAKGGINVLKAGYAEVWRDSLEAADTEIVLKMPSATRLTGRITRAGAPISGVEVRAVAVDVKDRWPVGVARTDAQGRYVMEDLQPGEVIVVAQGRGVGAAKNVKLEDRNRRRTSLQAGRTAVVDLSLVSAPSSRGRVLDDAGQPVAGAVVREVDDEHPRGWKSFAEEQRVLAVAATGADGTFLLEQAVAPSSRLEVRVVGHAAFLSVDPSKGPNGFDLRLPPVRRVEVLVLDDATEKPLVGATVEVLCWTTESSTKWKGVTGSDGRATSGPTIWGAYRVGAVEHGYAANGIGSRTEAEVPAKVTIRLSRASFLAGRVLLANKAPAAGATVSYFFELSDGYGAESSTLVGDDGSFRFEDVPPPPVRLELRAQPRGASRYNPGSLRTVAGTTNNVLVLE